MWSDHIYRLILSTVLSGAIYVVAGGIYRLCFSPLAQLPGPKVAALTSWYEFYYDYFKRGRFTWKLKDLHRQYGPIVRITPREIHINDPDFFSDQLYSFSANLDRYSEATKQFGIPDSTLFTVPHDLHKLRRAALAPFFSRSMVFQLEHVITAKVNKLCSRIQDYTGTKQPIDLGLAYRCLTTDVVTEYALAESYNQLDTPDFSVQWFRALRDSGEVALLAKHIPWLLPLMNSLPLWLVAILNREMAKSLAKSKVGSRKKSLMPHSADSCKSIEGQVEQIMSGQKDSHKPKGHKTVFHELYHSDLPRNEKTLSRLSQEGVLVVWAGSETTGNSLTVPTYHLLSQPDKASRLRKELTDAIPDARAIPSWKELEKLPYLSAVIKEGLRLAHGTSNRLPRVSKSSMKLHNWTIPPKTAISMSPMLIHENEYIFPNHREFEPERWLQNDKDLDKYLVAFGKGPRICLGMNLAYAELYVGLATVFRRFDLELYGTTREDVDAHHDFFVPSPKLDSKGMRVLVRKENRF